MKNIQFRESLIRWMANETSPFKVMVVEDDDDVARTIARKLGSDGHEVELTSDPRLAEVYFGTV